MRRKRLGDSRIPILQLALIVDQEIGRIVYSSISFERLLHLLLVSERWSASLVHRRLSPQDC